nr:MULTISPECIES: GrpB family protein [unclassified Pedobacter]
MDREVFKRNLNTNDKILDGIAHHLYVCPKDSKELKKHLLFRNQLRADELDCKEYQELKYKIAEDAKQNRKTYAAFKEVIAKNFVDKIIYKAKMHQTKLDII